MCVQYHSVHVIMVGKNLMSQKIIIGNVNDAY
jgi:hypothetical protein